MPLFFCAIPYHLIDNEVFPLLKGNHVKMLLVIDRRHNLKQKKFDQLDLARWKSRWMRNPTGIVTS